MRPGPGGRWGPPAGGPGWGDGRSWGGHRRRRPIGCALVVVLLLTAGLGAVGVWAIATTLGILPASPIVRVGAFVAVVIGLLVIVGIGRGIRRFSSPVDELIDAAGRIEGGDFSVRVSEAGPGPVRALARSFNAMSERLDANERQRRRFLADVAHELRTPLTVIQGRLEGVADGVYPADAASLQPALDEVQALERLVEDLRTLSLTETGTLALARESIDPALLVNDVVTAFQPAAVGAGVTLHALLPDPLELPALDVDPVRIRQVLANLVSNALAHTPAGGGVVVSALRSDDGGDPPGWVELTVADSGEGMAPELLPRAFDRFVKGEGSRGSGLGLAIARDLVVAHGGTITAESEGRGLGTRVRIRLPIGERQAGR